MKSDYSECMRGSRNLDFFFSFSGGCSCSRGRLGMDGQELLRDPGLGGLSDPGQSDVPQLPLQTPLPCEPGGQAEEVM